MEVLSVSTFRAPGHVTGILQAKNRQKIDKFEPIYLGNCDIDEKRFVVFEQTINHFLVVFI